MGLFELVGTEIEIDKIPVKVNGTIQEVLTTYRKMFIPNTVLMRDYYAVLKYRDQLSLAVNPWQHYHQDIMHTKVEKGMTAMETAFEFGAMKLVKQKPTDVISAAFFTVRNEFGLEKVFLDFYLQKLSTGEDALIVNPSPYVVAEFEKRREGVGRNYYVVSDSTIAGLYGIQYPKASFLAYDDVIENRFDYILIINRDSKETSQIMKWGELCNDSIFAELPRSYIENPKYCAHRFLAEQGLSITEIELLDSELFTVSPKLRCFVSITKADTSVSIRGSRYDKKTRSLCWDDRCKIIDSHELINTYKYISQLLKQKEGDENKESVYSAAKEYFVTDEVRLFYAIYKKGGSHIGKVWYRELVEPSIQKYGKRVTALVERGLRAKEEEDIIGKLSEKVLDSQIYPYVQNDIFRHYIEPGNTLSLKTLWLFYREQLKSNSKYLDEVMMELFSDGNNQISRVKCPIYDADTVLDALSQSLRVEKEDIPSRYLHQLNILFVIAAQTGFFTSNPLFAYMQSVSNRMSKRQQDIRNVFAKKHFTDLQEERIFQFLIEQEKDNVNGAMLPRCVKNSLWLAGMIRLFTGMPIREVCGLRWTDYIEIEDTGEYQFIISKFVDSDAKSVLHAEREDWTRFRCIPIVGILRKIMEQRKEYLLRCGVPERVLLDSPIILAREDIKGLINSSRELVCKPAKVQEYCRKLLEIADIPQKMLLLPDVQGERYTDIYKYGGDIFLFNLRMRLSHECMLTAGEQCYVVGVDGVDTFSRHYCDYSNSLLQYAILHKMNRWAKKYEYLFEGRMPKQNRKQVFQQKDSIVIGDGCNCASGEIVITSQAQERTSISLNITSDFGNTIEIQRYKG